MLFVTEIEVSYFLQLTSFEEYFFTEKAMEKKGKQKGKLKERTPNDDGNAIAKDKFQYGHDYINSFFNNFVKLLQI